MRVTTWHSSGTSAAGRWAIRPPTGFMRDLVVERKGEHVGRLDVKHGGITIIGNIARLEGVRAGISDKETLDRLAGAATAGTLDADLAAELAEAFRFLWEVRLKHQAQQLRSRRAPGRLRRPIDARARDQARAQGVVRRHRESAARAGDGTGCSDALGTDGAAYGTMSVPIAWKPPSTWISSPVMPAERSENRNAIASPDRRWVRCVPAERRATRPRIRDLVEPGDALAGHGLQRAGRHGVHPDPLRTQVSRQVARHGLEPGLRHAHPVVDRPREPSVEVEADDRAAVRFHQREQPRRDAPSASRRSSGAPSRRSPTAC